MQNKAFREGLRESMEIVQSPEGDEGARDVEGSMFWTE